MNEIKQVAIYVRVSDNKKKSDGERRQDVGRQTDMIEEYLIRAGKSKSEWEIYCDDGCSAYTEDINQRPAFKRMMSDCIRHYIKEIYVEDITRFSRNLALGIEWLNRLSELNVHLISIKEGQLEYTTSKGWMQSNILLLLAEWESKIRSEKVKSGMARAKEAGKNVGRRKVGPIRTPPIYKENKI
jgi:DNA invertase Pin-like site-specific DNA recombinase